MNGQSTPSAPDGDGKRRLAHAASADDRDEACRKQLPRKQEGIIGPPDHSGQAARQIGMRKTRDFMSIFGSFDALAEAKGGAPSGACAIARVPAARAICARVDPSAPSRSRFEASSVCSQILPALSSRGLLHDSILNPVSPPVSSVQRRLPFGW